MPVDAALSRDGMSFMGEMWPDSPGGRLWRRRVRRGMSLGLILGEETMCRTLEVISQ
jgi:hypothetical protein